MSGLLANVDLESVDGSSSVSSIQESRHSVVFYKLSKLIIDVGTEVLRDLFRLRWWCCYQREWNDDEYKMCREGRMGEYLMLKCQPGPFRSYDITDLAEKMSKGREYFTAGKSLDHGKPLSDFDFCFMSRLLLSGKFFIVDAEGRGEYCYIDYDKKGFNMCYPIGINDLRCNIVEYTLRRAPLTDGSPDIHARFEARPYLDRYGQPVVVKRFQSKLSSLGTLRNSYFAHIKSTVSLNNDPSIIQNTSRNLLEIIEEMETMHGPQGVVLAEKHRNNIVSIMNQSISDISIVSYEQMKDSIRQLCKINAELEAHPHTRLLRYANNHFHAIPRRTNEDAQPAGAFESAEAAVSAWDTHLSSFLTENGGMIMKCQEGLTSDLKQFWVVADITKIVVGRMTDEENRSLTDDYDGFKYDENSNLSAAVIAALVEEPLDTALDALSLTNTTEKKLAIPAEFLPPNHLLDPHVVLEKQSSGAWMIFIPSTVQTEAKNKHVDVCVKIYKTTISNGRVGGRVKVRDWLYRHNENSWTVIVPPSTVPETTDTPNLTCVLESLKDWEIHLLANNIEGSPQNFFLSLKTP